MPLGHFYARGEPPSGGTTGSVRRVVGSGLAAADEASSRLRDAGERIAGTDEGASGVRDRAEARLRSRVEAALEDEVGLSEAERRAHADRRLRAYLRWHDLDEARVADRTLARLREAFEPEPPSVDDVLDAIDGGTHSNGEPDAGPDSDPSDTMSDALHRFCREAGIDADASLAAIVDEVVATDAVTVARAVETVAETQGWTEEAEPPAEPTARSVRGSGNEPHADGESPVDIAGPVSFDGPAGPPGIDSTSSGVGSTVALVALSLLLIGDDPPAGADGGGLDDLLGTLRGGDADAVTALSRIEGLVHTVRGSGETGPTGEIGESGSFRSKGAKALVGLFVANLVAMSVGAYLSRKHAPPIPDEIRGPDGEVVVTEEAVTAGKQVFQANGLMNHGSVLGNGSYYGSDLTADALQAKVDAMRDYYAEERGAESFDALDDDAQAAVAQRVEDELDRRFEEGDVLDYSAAEAYAHQQLREEYVDRFHGGRREHGIPAETVGSPEEAERLADFAAWTAWMAHTNRPDASHSYTNDWPYVPGAGNRPTEQVIGWSSFSVLLLIAGAGLGVWAYQALDFAEPATEAVDVPTPDSVSITSTQYVSAWYVPVAGALFAVQVLAGALLAHYYVERDGFFGVGDALDVDLLSLLPFSVVRTWHVNLGILWIAALWLAGGLFLPGLFSDDDPPRQATGAAVLLGALVVTIGGAFTGVWLGIQGKLGAPADGERWWLFGSEGLEYLEAGRVWKGALLAALVGWTGLVYRGVRRVDARPTGLGHFLVYAGGSIALLFGASMLYTPETNLAVTEFWRWWVVHMWVEGVFEFFVTAVTAVALVSMDLLEQSAAEKAILFEVFAIMGAGILGVSHHYWWVGLPDFWVPIGTTFSTLEFVPLLFILYQSLEEYRTLEAQSDGFPYALPLCFIVGSSLWNFVGGGVLGFFINIPVINYYEHGTYLTVAHGHTATFGAFGLLALGLGTYVLRVVTPEESWEPGWFRATFWLTNVGLTLMTVASLLPLGFSQLRAVYTEGYDAARSPEFYERPRTQKLLWARSLGDAPMILGALAFTVGAVRQLLAARDGVDGPFEPPSAETDGTGSAAG